jgi:spore cortex biosynthesis protein YabQ
MILPVDLQLYYFLTSIIAGLAIGIMFDLYRIIRGFDCPGKAVTMVSDLLFWIFSAIIIFLFFLYSNNAYLRYNTFIGLLLGALLYFRIISRLILKSLRFITFYIIKVFRILIILILYPIKLIKYFLNFIFFKLKESSRKRPKKPTKVKREKKAKKGKKPAQV